MKHTTNILILIMAMNMSAGFAAYGKEKVYKIDFSGQEAFYCQEIAENEP